MNRYLLWHGVAEAAEAGPDRLAITCGSDILSHGQLDDLAARIGGTFVGGGARRGDRVGVFAPKSVRVVACMLGALRTGLTYVPVDPAQPASRAGLILANAGVRVLVTTPRLLATLHAAGTLLPELRQVVFVEDGPRLASEGPEVGHVPWSEVVQAPRAPPALEVVEDDPAYILYTSGSTGVPKGVAISHRNALTFVEWALHTFAVQPEDRLSNHAPFHFDLSVFDLYAALQAGASVHLVPDRLTPFPPALAAWIESQGITVWYSVPSALIRLSKQGGLERFTYRKVRAILFAGEVFPVGHLQAVMAAFPHSRFYNLYGPTETNVCTWYEVPRPLDPMAGDLPIGRSCTHSECIAVTDGRRTAVGEEGELLVRGPSVMLGYWGLPEQTAESIIQNPLHDDFRDPVYRTGDIVKPQADGSFRFVGRRDYMVKTRGYRVELGEIEYQLHQCAGVAAAAVVALPDPDIGAYLVAAVMVEPGGPGSEALAEHCAARLPKYAVPERFAVLDEMPYTSTGKVDRQRLAVLLTDTFKASLT